MDIHTLASASFLSREERRAYLEAMQRESERSFTPGQRVAVTDYGREKTGTVTRNDGNGIVFVRLAETGRTRWFHAASLRLAR